MVPCCKVFRPHCKVITDRGNAHTTPCRNLNLKLFPNDPSNRQHHSHAINLPILVLSTIRNAFISTIHTLSSL